MQFPHFDVNPDTGAPDGQGQAANGVGVEVRTQWKAHREDAGSAVLNQWQQRLRPEEGRLKWTANFASSSSRVPC